jgi:hypothetical protein
VADAVEPVGQDVDQKAADELVGVEGHELVASVALSPVIFPFESYALAVEGDENSEDYRENSIRLLLSDLPPESMSASNLTPIGLDDRNLPGYVALETKSN